MRLSISALLMLLLATPTALAQEKPSTLDDEQEFKGKIARSYEDSQEWWPEPVRPHPDAPDQYPEKLEELTP